MNLTFNFIFNRMVFLLTWWERHVTLFPSLFCSPHHRSFHKRSHLRQRVRIRTNQIFVDRQRLPTSCFDILSSTCVTRAWAQHKTKREFPKTPPRVELFHCRFHCSPLRDRRDKHTPHRNHQDALEIVFPK